ncbi:queuosine precursor transporter [Candidatus Undinarchaeota archaeon]
MKIKWIKKSLTLDAGEKAIVLVSLFIAALVAANLLGNKITVLGGIVVSVGIFAYPITFLIANIFGEVQGPKLPRMLVIGGIVSIIAVLVFTSISIALPAAARFTYNAEYFKVFSMTKRIMVGSLVAFFFAQGLNIHIFDYFKRKFKKQNPCIRYNAAVIVSQFIDTVIFYFIAFYHMTPKFTAAFIMTLVFPYWFMKIIFSIASTPLFYGGVRWFNKDMKTKLPPIAIPIPIIQPAPKGKKK